MAVLTLGLTTAAALLAACSEDSSGSAAELCGAVGDRQSFASTFEGFDPSDPPGAIATLREARVELGDLRDAAPGEVRDDLDVQIDGIQSLLDALEDLGPQASAANAVAAVRGLSDELSGVDKATAALDRWYSEQCTGRAETSSTAHG